MLKFPCICGKNFALENDQAGSEFQCPACGRLIVAPTHDELASINSDGTYTIDTPPPGVEPGRWAELNEAFGKHKVDEYGREIDLRSSISDFMQVGDVPGPGEPAEPKPAPSLRYDPETGELVEPLAIKPSEPILAEPVDALPLGRATLGYARGNVAHGISPLRILFELLMPHNIIVIVFIVLFHALLIGAGGMTAAGFFFSAPVAVVCFMAIAGQYALVLEETGPEEKDEIPRPLRWFSWRDDIWKPFVTTMLALAYSFGPAVVVNLALPDAKFMGIWIGLYLAGAVVLPAAMLTTVTSDMLNNLRPDRVARVIAVSGMAYWAVAGAMLTGLALYLAAMSSCMIGIFVFFGGHLGTWVDLPIFLRSPTWGTPMLFAGVYMLHFAAWFLGLVWRQHHASYPWVGQRHIRMTPEEKMASLAAHRAVAKHQQEMRRISRGTIRRMGGRF